MSGSNDPGAVRIKQSRAARIISQKNDLVCIKDVANYYDLSQRQKSTSKMILEEDESKPNL